MAGVKEFEEYDCWKLARELANLVYTLTREDLVKRDYGYVDQIRRASVSVMNNIAEGHERGSNKEFVKFLYVARGSAGEVRNMLYVGLDQKYIDHERFEDLKALAVRTAKACYGLIRYLSKNLDWKAKLSIFIFLLIMPLAKTY
jgi:four helix bundle protein